MHLPSPVDEQKTFGKWVLAKGTGISRNIKIEKHCEEPLDLYCIYCIISRSSSNLAVLVEVPEAAS